MNKIWLIMQREILNRVQKKSFLIATILVPLIFPAIFAILGWMAIQQKKDASKQTVYYIDASGVFTPDTSKFRFKKFDGPLDDAKKAIVDIESFGLLYIPEVDLGNPKGITLYTNVDPSPGQVGDLEQLIANQLRDRKMKKFNIRQELLDSLKTDVNIQQLNLSGGKEQESDSKVLFGVGMGSGILMYMFILIYGGQIMQGVIEEKTSKVVEVIVSSVRPFQLMLGKIFGLASVGLLQFIIWIVLVTTLSTLTLGAFGVQSQELSTINEQATAMQSQGVAMQTLKMLSQIPFGYVIFNFLFYFLGGYLLYGALFAAVGSAVDSPQEAQQFMFPITIPLIFSYFGLFIFVLDNPNGAASVWLSMIPFTSPIAMMGRIAFHPPLWQLILSMILLVAGFIFTAWVAARIYRVGILMHGTKVNYKVLAKWFMQKG